MDWERVKVSPASFPDSKVSTGDELTSQREREREKKRKRLSDQVFFRQIAPEG